MLVKQNFNKPHTARLDQRFQDALKSTLACQGMPLREVFQTFPTDLLAIAQHSAAVLSDHCTSCMPLRFPPQHFYHGVFHIGLGYQLRDNLVFALDLEQAFEEKMGYSDRAQLALGVQYSPVNILPLRAGMSFGGIWKYRMALGLGLHLGFFHIDFAYAMHKGLWPTEATGISTAANIKLVF